MLYFDGQHLVADTEKELHEFARGVLLFPFAWYDDTYKKGLLKGKKKDHPHYDVLSRSKQIITARHPDVKFISDKEEFNVLAHKMIKE